MLLASTLIHQTLTQINKLKPIKQQQQIDKTTSATSHQPPLQQIKEK